MKHTVIITTASKLADSQKRQVRNQLRKKLGKDIAYQEVVDPSVVGGIRLLINGQEMDATIAGSLNELDSQLPKVVLTSAVALNAKQRSRLKKALDEKYGSLEYQEVVDPSVLGGLKLTIGSQEYDGTVRTKLDRLQVQVFNQL